MQPPGEPREHTRAVAPLPLDETGGGRVDSGDAVERLEQPLVRSPEPDGAPDQLAQGHVDVCQLAGGPGGAQLGALGDGLADGVDEAQPGAEVLVQRRAGDTGPIGDLLHRRLVEGALLEQLADGGDDPLTRARRLRSPARTVCAGGAHGQ